MSYPILDKVMKAADVQTKPGRFQVSYVNWSKVSHLLREHAPGWQPITEKNDAGGMLHTAPDGTFYLMIAFQFMHPGQDGGLPYRTRTVAIPHAIMDHTMNPKKNPSSRDISDGFVRGMCKAAALLFGLGWQLWSKDDPFERDDEPAAQPVAQPAPKPAAKKKPGSSFPDKASALKGLSKVKTKAEMTRWVGVMKDSQFSDDDRNELIAAYREATVQTASDTA